MKYIIFYLFYSTTSIEANITTAIRIYEDKVDFYVYDIGYIQWNIIDKEEDLDSRKTCLMATYHLQYKDMKALIKTNCNEAIIIIFVEGEIEHITLRKRK